jgi:hypothetical protein
VLLTDIPQGHDTTLMPILSGFGVWDGKWAPYASYVIFEIYQQGRALHSTNIYTIKNTHTKHTLNTPSLVTMHSSSYYSTIDSFSHSVIIQGTAYYVRMVWNSKEMTIPGCGGPLCPYTTFTTLMKQLIITDPHTQCSLIQ